MFGVRSFPFSFLSVVFPQSVRYEGTLANLHPHPYLPHHHCPDGLLHLEEISSGKVNLMFKDKLVMTFRAATNSYFHSSMSVDSQQRHRADMGSLAVNFPNIN